MPVIGWKVGNENDPDDRVGEATAKVALAALCKAYPGYSWITEVRGGVLIVRNYSLDWRGRWCMVLKLGDLENRHKALTRSVVRAGGEFLERAHQQRGPMMPGQESSPVLEGAALVGAKRWTRKPAAPQVTLIGSDGQEI